MPHRREESVRVPGRYANRSVVGLGYSRTPIRWEKRSGKCQRLRKEFLNGIAPRVAVSRDKSAVNLRRPCPSTPKGCSSGKMSRAVANLLVRDWPGTQSDRNDPVDR